MSNVGNDPRRTPPGHFDRFTFINRSAQPVNIDFTLTDCNNVQVKQWQQLVPAGGHFEDFLDCALEPIVTMHGEVKADPPNGPLAVFDHTVFHPPIEISGADLWFDDPNAKGGTYLDANLYEVLA